MQGLAGAILEALGSGRGRDQPVAADLEVVIGGLENFVVEDVARLLVARAPDERLMCIGEPSAAEIRHRVGLAPDDVVQHPEAQILEGGAEAKDVVIGAADPRSEEHTSELQSL